MKPSGQQDNALPPMFEHDDVEYSRDDAGKRTEEYSRYSEIEEDEEPVETPVRRETPHAVFAERQEETVLPSRIDRETVSAASREPAAEAPRAAAEEPAREESPAPSFSRDRSRGLFAEEKAEEPAESNVPPFARRREITPEEPKAEETVAETKPENKAAEGFRPPVNVKYNRPPLDLFKVYRQDPNAPQEDYEELSRIIERTLSEFGIDAQVVNFVHGPTVTRYELSLPAGVSVKRCRTTRTISLCAWNRKTA